MTRLYEPEMLDFTDRACGDLSALGALGEDGTVELHPRRINATAETAEKDLAKLVLALVDMVRELLERQAIRRVNAGLLTEDEVERMGETFSRLDRRMGELATAFGVRREELNLCLASIRDLV